METSESLEVDKEVGGLVDDAVKQKPCGAGEVGGVQGAGGVNNGVGNLVDVGVSLRP